MPFRETFDCLWCGRSWRASGEADLTGWAALCAECLERAQDNSFLRYRVRAALRERSGGGAAPSPASAPAAEVPGAPAPTAGAQMPTAGAPAPSADAHAPSADAQMPTGSDVDAETLAYLAARATESDDRYQRHGRYSRGPARDLAWHMELDAATTWLDGQPLSGRIAELAAGTGWWSPLLAAKGELTLHDTSAEALDRARERLVAHRMRAHIHVRDAWAEPDGEVDGLFCGFWLVHVTEERLGDFLALVSRWLRPGGRFAFVDPLPDPEAGAVDEEPPVTQGVGRRRLADGRELRVVEVHRTPEALDEALRRAGFVEVSVTRTPRFFVMGTAIRPG